MPGVRRRLADRETERLRAESREGRKRSRLAGGAWLGSLVASEGVSHEGGVLRVASQARRPRTSQCTRPPTRTLSSVAMARGGG